MKKTMIIAISLASLYALQDAPPPPTVPSNRFVLKDVIRVYKVYDKKNKKNYITSSCRFFYLKKEINKIDEVDNLVKSYVKKYFVLDKLDYLKISEYEIEDVDYNECVDNIQEANLRNLDGLDYVVLVNEKNLVSPFIVFEKYREEYIKDLFKKIENIKTKEWKLFAIPFFLTKEETKKIVKKGILWGYEDGKWIYYTTNKDDEICKYYKCKNYIEEKGGVWFLKLFVENKEKEEE